VLRQQQSMLERQALLDLFLTTEYTRWLVSFFVERGWLSISQRGSELSLICTLADMKKKMKLLIG
jgi:hypothetical protein